MGVPAVYKAIAGVSADMAAQGIGKTRTNQQQGYKFRGIDDVMNVLAPMLVKHGLLILPRVLSRTVSERATKSGGALFYVVVESEFDFVAVEDGSKHIVKTFGEAMDSGDKATNKSESAAYKYAAFQAFCIPIEGDGDHDADAATPPEVAPLAQRLADKLDGESAERPRAANTASVPNTPPSSTATPHLCPTCNGEMWDNRDKRREAEAAIKAGTRELGKNGKPKAAPPAWKCKDKNCKGVIWECGDKPSADEPPPMAAPPVTPAPKADEPCLTMGQRIRIDNLAAPGSIEWATPQEFPDMVRKHGAPSGDPNDLSEAQANALIQELRHITEEQQ